MGIYLWGFCDLADLVGAFLDAAAVLGDRFVSALMRILLAVCTGLVGVGDALATWRVVCSNRLASPQQRCCGWDMG